MRKSDKKLDKQLRQRLTDICETALKSIVGFQWLTHTVNYANFPNSLKVICVFDNNDNLANYINSSNSMDLRLLIKATCQEMNIHLNNISAQIIFDSEENCAQQHQGNWAKRLA